MARVIALLLAMMAHDLGSSQSGDGAFGQVTAVVRRSVPRAFGAFFTYYDDFLVTAVAVVGKVGG